MKIATALLDFEAHLHYSGSCQDMPNRTGRRSCFPRNIRQSYSYETSRRLSPLFSKSLKWVQN